MDTRKSKPDVTLRETPLRNGMPDQKSTKIVQSSLAILDELSIADDSDYGGDPYNNTGAYCIIKSKEIVGE